MAPVAPIVTVVLSPEAAGRGGHAAAVARIDAEVRSELDGVATEASGELVLRDDLPPARSTFLLAGTGDLTMGFAQLRLLPTDPTTARFWIAVAPRERRRGAGTELLTAVRDLARREGRNVLATTAPLGTPAEPFLTSAGFRQGLESLQARLPMAEVDRAQLAAWAQTVPRGYVRVAWDSSTPENLLPGYVGLRRFFFDVTPGAVRREEAALDAQGFDHWVAAARDHATSDLVAYSSVLIDRRTPERARVFATMVRPDHRRRGLARSLKAGLVLRLGTERPDIRVLDTFTLSSNAAIIELNRVLGFSVHRRWAIFARRA